MKRPLFVVVSSFALVSLATPAHADEASLSVTEVSRGVALAHEPRPGPTRAAIREVQFFVAKPRAADVFDWVSPVFVWVEEGYAYFETSFSF